MVRQDKIGGLMNLKEMIEKFVPFNEQEESDKELMLKYIDDFSSEIPRDFLLRHLSASFAETIKWWMEEDTRHSPEEVASYYMAMVGK